jgi:predicted glutamine amidotransferase
MCGLSGVAGSVSLKEEKVVKTLLIFNQLRGTDATGVGSVSRSNHDGDGNLKMQIAKETGPFYFLEDTKRYNQVFAGVNLCYIGHNRSKTVGENNRKNAHPFLFPNIMGAHNGTLDFQNKNRLESGSSFSTDSEAIFNTIQVRGIEDTISRIDDTEAYALTWFDNNTNTLNLIRNEHRTLVYCYVNDGKTIAWSSEYGMLAAAIHREGLKPVDDKFIDLPVDTLHTWDIPLKADEIIKPPTRTKLVGRKTTVYYHSNSYWTKGDNKKKEDTNFQKANIGKDITVYEPVNKDTDEMEYGGLYVGYIPKKTTNITSNVDILKRVSDNLSKINNHVPQNKALTAFDIIRKRALEEAVKAGLCLQEEPPLFKIYENANIKVWRDSTTGKWSYLAYNSIDNKWDLWKDVAIPPADLPFKPLDINARHHFKHKGKKNKKRVYYKGYNGKLLDKQYFEELMSSGCIQCGRTPEWGNEVRFVTPQHEFFCEWCALTPQLPDQIEKLGKKAA